MQSYLSSDQGAVIAMIISILLVSQFQVNAVTTRRTLEMLNMEAEKPVAATVASSCE
jgi:hypothetical protein